MVLAPWNPWIPNAIPGPKNCGQDTSPNAFNSPVAEPSALIEDVVGPEAARKKIAEGERLVRAGHQDVARDAFLDATRLDPQNAFAWANLGAAEMLLDNPGSAHQSYRNALRVDPENWLANYNFAAYYVRSGAIRQAFDHLRRCLDQLESQGTSVELRTAIRDLETNPLYRELRDDERYRKLLREH